MWSGPSWPRPRCCAAGCGGRWISTVLDDSVATQDTVTQLIAAIRRVGREVPGAAEVIAEHCTGHDYAEAGKPCIACDDEQAHEALVDALVSDAHRLLGKLARAGVRPAGGPRRWRCWRWSPGKI